MGLIKWNPAGEIEPIEDDFSRILDSFFGFNLVPAVRNESKWTPRVNVEESENGFEITAELPGMDKKAISIEVQDGALAIRGEKNIEKEKKEANYHILERSHGKFERVFRLPKHVDINKIEANYNDGVLKINVPKTKSAKPKEIKIDVK
ncbi:Hsp20/alpha crystallin family protein [bacterium]|nr:Hsp20/alpha crystallin family protein [bacterium]